MKIEILVGAFRF